MGHTRGPWVMGGISSMREYEIGIWAQDRAVREEKIAIVFEHPDVGPGDACLISAAPDLLTALKAIDATVEGIPPDVAAQMMAAIAKAESR